MHRSDKTSSPPRLSIAQCAALACRLEVTASKLGNVYPGREFRDLGVDDFLAGAVVCGTVMERAGSLPVGQIVLQCVTQSQAVTKSNANLGIALLLGPIAKAAARTDPDRCVDTLRSGVAAVLGGLLPEDGRDVYEAIRRAAPGGLGDVPGQPDVRTTQDVDLLSAMRDARGRDTIAEQYCTDFEYVVRVVVPTLRSAIEMQGHILAGITRAQVLLLSNRIDTLIARKRGIAIAESVRQRATELQQTDGSPDYQRQWNALDNWLRDDENARNPGTTADLIAAGLFVLLLNGSLVSRL